MKNFLIPLLALAALLAPPLFAQGRDGGLANSTASPIVFNGLIAQAGVVKVSLYNPNTGDAKWVQDGKKFGSYTVGFQPGVPGQTADAVVLTLGTSSQRITLQGAADASAASIAAAAALKTSLADALARARSAPNSDPDAIKALEYLLSNAPSAGAEFGNHGRVTFYADSKGQQVITDGRVDDDIPFMVINNVTGAATLVDQNPFDRQEEHNPDGSTTHTVQDTLGRVISVITLPAPNSTAPAPPPLAAPKSTTPAPAAAK
jgi:hypothetical protein